MIPVLIVEDEFLVRVGLRSIIEWEKFGFTVVGDAPSAEKGLELYRRLRPFLILTDIRMSPMDGLEMIRTIRQSDRDVHFIIITAHSEFAYAQKAIRYGVDLYIDKADFVNEELEGALSAIALDFEAKHRQAAAPDGPAQRLPALRRAQLEARGDELRRWLSENDLPGEGLHMAVCRYNHAGAGGVNPHTMAVMLAEMLEEADVPYSLFTRQGFVVALAPAAAGVLAGCLEKAAASLHKYTRARVGGGVAPVAPQRPLREAFHTACQACNNQIFEQNRPAAPADAGAGRLSPGDNPAAIRQELALLLQAGSAKEAAAETRHLLLSAQNFRELEQGVFCVVSVLESLDEGPGASSLLLEVLQMDDPAEMCSFFESRFQSLILAGARPKARYVADILAYIQDHLTEDLTLRTLADRFHLSASYLGKLFHQQTGAHLNGYVTSCRLNKACQLIRTTHHPVGEVAAMVGIENPHYFSRLFKEKMGLSPHQYRSRLAAQTTAEGS